MWAPLPRAIKRYDRCWTRAPSNTFFGRRIRSSSGRPPRVPPPPPSPFPPSSERVRYPMPPSAGSSVRIPPRCLSFLKVDVGRACGRRCSKGLARKSALNTDDARQRQRPTRHQSLVVLGSAPTPRHLLRVPAAPAEGWVRGLAAVGPAYPSCSYATPRASHARFTL